MIHFLVYLRYFIVFATVFMGFYFQTSNPTLSLRLVSMGLVGFTGILSFISHVPLHKADSKRLGWETDRPDWQFEVGFANLAFGVLGIIASMNAFCDQSRSVIITAYGIYLFQAAILHLVRALQSKPVNTKKLILSSGLTFVFVAFMAYFVLSNLQH